jgi:ribose transport system ATP-binding protein
VGAGRTELLRSLFGLAPVRKGRIKLGIYTGPASPVKRWMQGAGLLSENRKEEGLALSLSVADNVTLSRLKGFGPLGLVLPSRQDKATLRWLQQLDIRCRGPQQSVSSLSGGNQQKVAMARLLQHDVDVLLLDEPTRGIDVAAKALVYKLINALATGSLAEGREPKAVLMVSSYLPELMGVCDRVTVMCRGRLGPTHRIDEVNEHDLMLEATGQEI